MHLQDKRHFSSLLKGALRDCGSSITDETALLLAEHFILMRQWNKIHNLTTVDDLENAIWVHYVDSILGIQLISREQDVLDFGSGAGFPGIIAAVMWPDSQLRLVDTARKKISFLKIAVQKMGLKNVKILEDRAENLDPASLVITRAAITLDNLDLLASCVKNDGRVAMWISKPHRSDVEEKLLRSGLELQAIAGYSWPDSGDRGIILAKKIA